MNCLKSFKKIISQLSQKRIYSHRWSTHSKIDYRGLKTKNIQKLGALLLAALLLAARTYAQDVPVSSTGALRFHVDRASFRDADGKAYQEFYLMLYADQLHLSWLESKGRGAIQVTATVKDLQENEILRSTWTTEITVSRDSLDARGLAIYDQWTTELAAGQYLAIVDVVDSNGSGKGEARWAIEVSKSGDESATASDIEFVSRAETGVTESYFTKGNRTVIPNPARRYGVLNPTMYFYYELYGLPALPGEMMNVIYTISERDGKTVKTLPAIRVRQPGATASLLHGLDVSKLASGVYSLTAQVQDTAGLERVRLSRNFEVIQADYLGAPPALTDEQIQRAERLLKHCASGEQYEFFQKLDATGKAEFLIRFWRDNDPTPGTQENEYLAAMQQRFQYAQEHFRWGTEGGEASDRGHVLIKYGMPDEIETHHSEAGAAPYEIWIYRQPRMDLFIFGDLRSDGRFVLLHSTKENEVRNPSWAELIRKF